MGVHGNPCKSVDSHNVFAEMRLVRRVSHRACDHNIAPRKEVCLPEMMRDVRVSNRSHLETGEAADRRSDAPMVVAMEMATAATPITAETAGATI